MTEGFSSLLRAHRARRRWSQEALALEAGVSARHLSCLETGKAQPSREMVVLLSRVLGLELRERNAMLVSAGFAALHPTTPLGGLALAPVNRAIDLILSQQEPYGAVVLDRGWNVLRANDGARRILGTFMQGDVPAAVAGNLVRAALHPRGLRPSIVNWTETVAIVLERVERAHHANPADPERHALLEDLRSYPDVTRHAAAMPATSSPTAVLHLRRGADELRLFVMLTTIGTPIDVTAQELTIESLFPADEPSERWFRDALRSRG